MTPWDPYLEEAINKATDYLVAGFVFVILIPVALIQALWEKIR